MAISILGISAFYHDSAAALIQDGTIVAAAQEERFTRKKFDPGFPANAINFCLQERNLEISQLDYVVFYDKPLVKFERLLETYLAFAPTGFESFRRALPVWAKHKLRIPQAILAGLGRSFRGELLFANHHESHAASAFFPSPFEDAAILTMDAVGEWATSSIGVGEGNQVKITRDLNFPHSLGMLYSAFTYYTGFVVNSGEYKLMGLAPYGKPKYVDMILNTMAHLYDDGSLWLDMSYFNYCQGVTMTSEKFHDLFGGAPRKPETFITEKEMDLAASVQVVCEEAVLRAARHAHKLTGKQNLVMAGGVALNYVANGRLLREGPFEQIWVQPAAGDAGGALGAAYVIWHHHLKQPRRSDPHDSQEGSCLGPAFTDDDIALFLDSLGARFRRFSSEKDLLRTVAEKLAGGQIVGWFHGRMEYGPRALGCRSIIGDARAADMQQRMNLKIKFRESFRPFAPVVLREYVDQVFQMRPNEDSPYMLFVAPVRENLRIATPPEDEAKLHDPDLRIRVAMPRSSFPAITHVDYSARIQTVDQARHGRFYRLMKQFYELTGSPVLVNTSFNIRGEPIVCTPEQALRSFMATEIDCLVIEDCVITKEDLPANLFEDSWKYRAEFALD